jgi:hypothetical protein
MNKYRDNRKSGNILIQIEECNAKQNVPIKVSFMKLSQLKLINRDVVY